ncbi:bifunctional DNA primase/polymerase [Actinomadura scrupuli]|uniref:bifunctional DNA primase/polymerase n=1 Tax=Actinomadura scrupuli TaxID=559629 RepID=UPI003D99D82B
MLTVGGSRRQRTRDRLATAARGYAGLGWACVRGAQATVDGDRACSCDRLGCPDPAAHPVSAAWAMQATTDVEVVNRWWAEDPAANVILPTGRVFDVIDVPAEVGALALDRIVRDGGQGGPVAAFGADRYLFFVATRGAPDDEDEWWSCHLDCSPENIAETPGMRWHCRESYVVAPPSVLPYGREVGWIRPPDGSPLPDPLRLLEVLADTYDF